MRLIVFILLSLFFQLNAQKPVVTEEAISSFPILSATQISNNGTVVSYNQYEKGKGKKMIVQDVERKWKIERMNADLLFFTSNSKGFYFKVNDSLYEQSAGQNQEKFISKVASWKNANVEGNEWLGYIVNDDSKALIIQGIGNGKTYKFSSIKDFYFDPSGNTVLLRGLNTDSTREEENLSWVDLSSGVINSIWTANDDDALSQVVFDKSGTQLAYTVFNKKNDQYSIWYYSKLMLGAASIVNKQKLIKENSNLLVSNRPIVFTDDGQYLFFSLMLPAIKLEPGVDVWSYVDPVLQSAQLAELYARPSRYYRSAISTTDKSITIVENNFNRIVQNDFARLKNFGESTEVRQNEVVLYVNREGDGHEFMWNKKNLYSLLALNLKTKATDTLLINQKQDYPDVYVSPSGNYVLYFNVIDKNWYSYEVNYRKVVKVSDDQSNWTSNDFQSPNGVYTACGIICWYNNEPAVLVLDWWGDVWKLNLNGKKKPVCISKKVAFQNKIKFNYHADKNLSIHSEISSKDKVYLAGKDETNKLLGLYELSEDKSPVLITTDFGPEFLKAKDENVYMLYKAHSSEFKNLYLSKGFKSYNALTTLQPEKAYNWYTSEVINWKTQTGSNCSGILYKPENIDSTKKYPLIVQYYDHKDVAYLNDKPKPAVLETEILVSNGYLVFHPNIHYYPGIPAGESALNAVVSGAEYLSKRNYVNPNKMAVMGHSFGGYQTSYIITQSNIFAAACAMNGMTDMTTTFYLSSRDYDDLETTMPKYTSMGQPRIGEVTIWERPDLYIRNSPVYYADKVTTPLLMVNNKDDRRVQFSQGYLFFSALRMLGKRAWMLQYDGGGHGGDYNDFSKRLQQFYDHYLRDAPAPIWMTRGVPAELKGKEKGFEFDSKMKTPGAGLVLDDSLLNINPERRDLLKEQKTITREGLIFPISEGK